MRFWSNNNEWEWTTAHFRESTEGDSEARKAQLIPKKSLMVNCDQKRSWILIQCKQMLIVRGVLKVKPNSKSDWNVRREFSQCMNCSPVCLTTRWKSDGKWDSGEIPFKMPELSETRHQLGKLAPSHKWHDQEVREGQAKLDRGCRLLMVDSRAGCQMRSIECGAEACENAPYPSNPHLRWTTSSTQSHESLEISGITWPRKVVGSILSLGRCLNKFWKCVLEMWVLLTTGLQLSQRHTYAYQDFHVVKNMSIANCVIGSAMPVWGYTQK